MKLGQGKKCFYISGGVWMLHGVEVSLFTPDSMIFRPYTARSR